MSCSLCETPFDHDEHLQIHLPCGHTFCLRCLIELYHHSNFECPEETNGIRCRRPIPIPDHPDQEVILRTLRGMAIDPSQINIGEAGRAGSDRRPVGDDGEPAVVHPRPPGVDPRPVGVDQIFANIDFESMMSNVTPVVVNQMLSHLGERLAGRDPRPIGVNLGSNNDEPILAGVGERPANIGVNQRPVGVGPRPVGVDPRLANVDFGSIMSNVTPVVFDQVLDAFGRRLVGPDPRPVGVNLGSNNVEAVPDGVGERPANIGVNQRPVGVGPRPVGVDPRLANVDFGSIMSNVTPVVFDQMLGALGRRLAGLDQGPANVNPRFAGVNFEPNNVELIRAGVVQGPANVEVGQRPANDNQRPAGVDQRPAVASQNNVDASVIPAADECRPNPEPKGVLEGNSGSEAKGRNSAFVYPINGNNTTVNTNKNKINNQDSPIANCGECSSCFMPWLVAICFSISVIGNLVYIIVLAYYAGSNSESEDFVSSILLIILLAICEAMIVLFFVAIYNLLDLCAEKIFLKKMVCIFSIVFCILYVAYFIYIFCIYSEELKNDTLFNLNACSSILVFINILNFIFITKYKLPCFRRFLYSCDQSLKIN